MKNIRSYKIYEAAPRIPRLTERGLEYWKKKGKRGKDVMIYTHDDMDGIFSAIAVKSRLLDLGYNIIGYGILNYMESWKATPIDPEIINVAVDFAEMPKKDNKDLIDIYIDHHGEYSEEEKEFYKENPVIKTHTGSAYEGICNVLGKQIDEITLYSIDMIDSAKYDDYMVDWRDILNFSWDRFKEIADKPGKVEIKPFSESKSVKLGWSIIAKLTFAGAFNQFLKRSDHKTVIEVIDNVKDPSIYGIYNAMKKVYPGNNVWEKGYSKGKGKDFVADSQWRLDQMQNRTRGKITDKKIFMSQTDYMNTHVGLAPSGYQIIGNLMFVPSGTWANALRARSILMTEYDSGVIPQDHKVNFILLQYGNTLQVCSVEKMEKMENLPVLKDGTKVNNLGEYMKSILSNFQKYFGYFEPDTSIGQDELTVSGGHVGIGTISNIVGRVDLEKIENRKKLDEKVRSIISKYDGYKYLDLIKNKIISDLSGLGDQWLISMVWSGDDNDDTAQLIRDIIKNHPTYKKRVKDVIEDANKYGLNVEEAEKEIKERIKEELLQMEKTRLRDLHGEAMMGHKVMMKPDIRQIDVRGNIPSREEWDGKKIKNFESFINEGKIMKATKTKDKDIKIRDFRDTIENLIKSFNYDYKKIGTDLEITKDKEIIAQIMFRDDYIGVKKIGNKFAKEFDYNELGKIKAELKSILKK